MQGRQIYRQGRYALKDRFQYRYIGNRSEGFKRELEINGVGYRFQVSGNKLSVFAGYSHQVDLQIPNGIKVEIPEKSTTELIISGYDKQAVSEFASNVRKVRKPEPYKGKGIKFKEEHIRRKEGKKAA